MYCLMTREESQSDYNTDHTPKLNFAYKYVKTLLYFVFYRPFRNHMFVLKLLTFNNFETDI